MPSRNKRFYCLLFKLKLEPEPEPEPGQSDGSGSSQIPRLRLRNPDFEDCIFIAKNTGGSKFRDKFDLLITEW